MVNTQPLLLSGDEFVREVKQISRTMDKVMSADDLRVIRAACRHL